MAREFAHRSQSERQAIMETMGEALGDYGNHEKTCQKEAAKREPTLFEDFRKYRF